LLGFILGSMMFCPLKDYDRNVKVFDRHKFNFIGSDFNNIVVLDDLEDSHLETFTSSRSQLAYLAKYIHDSFIYMQLNQSSLSDALAAVRSCTLKDIVISFKYFQVKLQSLGVNFFFF
jgi:hypothetical protein